MSSTPLQQLINGQQLWPAKQRKGRAGSSANRCSATGFPSLDKALHQGGWPRNGSCELLCTTAGIGELSLVLPALGQLAKQRPIAWLNPPWLPFAPGLQQQQLDATSQWLIRAPKTQQLWAAEETLRSGVFAALLSWSSDPQLQNRQLRRLHIAAREGDCWHIHFRSPICRQQASPAPLRLLLSGKADSLQLEILKQSGGHAGQRLNIERPKDLLWRQQPASQWPVQTAARQRLILPPTRLHSRAAAVHAPLRPQ